MKNNFGYFQWNAIVMIAIWVFCLSFGIYVGKSYAASSQTYPNFKGTNPAYAQSVSYYTGSNTFACIMEEKILAPLYTYPPTIGTIGFGYWACTVTRGAANAPLYLRDMMWQLYPSPSANYNSSAKYSYYYSPSIPQAYNQNRRGVSEGNHDFKDGAKIWKPWTDAVSIATP